MKKNLLKVVGYSFASAACLLVATEPALAVGFNDVASNVKEQFSGVLDVMSGLAYIGGVGFGIKSAMKLKEYNEQQGKVPLSTPIMLALVAAILIALPTFLSKGQESVFGTGATKTSINGGGSLKN